VYCGNFEYDARQSEIERLFKEYGRVDRVDMKTGKLLLFLWSLSNGSIHVNPASDN
jgi:arginine/serine-rich splicing factor 4/5/6